ANFMGDHVSLSEITRRGEARGHFIEELQIQINLPVTGTVEGAHSRAGEAAGRADAPTKQYQCRVAGLRASLLERRAPGVFGIAKDGLDERYLKGVAIGRRTALLGGRRAGLVGQLAENL